MTVITGARRYIEPPIARPKVGGILSVADVVDASDPHLLLGAEYQTDACYAISQWLSNCGNYPDPFCDPPETPTVIDKKVFHALTTVVGDPFTLYDGIECRSLGDPVDSQRAARSLALKEERGVEERLTAIFDAWPGAPASAVTTVVDAIQALEKWLEENYAGQGLIGMTRGVAIAAASQHVVVAGLDGTMSTATGTPVVLGLGDDDTIFASGQITLLRGPVLVHSVPEMLLPDNECAPARVLAERTYVPLVECGVAEANITPAP